MHLFEEYSDIVTVKDPCEMLDIGKNTAYKLLNDGTIKSIKIGKIHKIPKIYLIEYIKQSTCNEVNDYGIMDA